MLFRRNKGTKKNNGSLLVTVDGEERILRFSDIIEGYIIKTATQDTLILVKNGHTKILLRD